MGAFSGAQLFKLGYTLDFPGDCQCHICRNWTVYNLQYGMVPTNLYFMYVFLDRRVVCELLAQWLPYEGWTVKVGSW